jgi:hypothetical protein
MARMRSDEDTPTVDETQASAEQPTADELLGPFALADVAARMKPRAASSDKPAVPPTSPMDFVVGRSSEAWFVLLWIPPLLTGVLAFAVATAGGIVALTYDTRLTLSVVLASTVLIALIVFAFSVSMPTELRVSDKGIRARTWREANNRIEGRFFETGCDARFELVGSGSYLSAPGREPVRIRLPMLAIRRAANRAGVPLVLYRSWWAWRVLGWAGLFLWGAITPIGGLMLIAGLVVRTFSSLRGQVLNEAD